MLNFFGTNQVVPNGYIYTSGTGSKYICLEGVWFNNETLKLVNPSKTDRMNEAATKQILEHNKSAKTMIGEGFTFADKNYVYLGENRFLVDGQIAESSIISEVIADDQRTYQVPRDILNKEWTEIGFYILPPHAEDITIPAGLDVHGYKFIPNGQKFINTASGKIAPPELQRKLWSDGERMARIINGQRASQLFPVKSVLVSKNSNIKSEWNGKEFCDNDGNVIVDAAKVGDIRQKYMEFIQANPHAFPTLTNIDNINEPEQPEEQKPYKSMRQPAMDESITEAEDDSTGTRTQVPNGYRVKSKSGKTYIKKGTAWIDVATKKALNSSAAKTVESAAQEFIKKHNKSSAIKIGSTFKAKSGTVYKYVGGTEFVSEDGKRLAPHIAQGIIDRMQKESDDEKAKSAPEEQPEAKPEPTPEPEAEPSPAPEVKPETAPASTEDNSTLDGLAQRIKSSPYAKKIRVLLTRGDTVSLMAADIMLNGQRDEALQILKSLNSNDE